VPGVRRDKEPLSFVHPFLFAFDQQKGTSFQNDFAKPQKRDEREIFGGTILRLCKKERIRCDITAELYQKLNAIKPYCA